jgi:hypothetical protein
MIIDKTKDMIEEFKEIDELIEAFTNEFEELIFSLIIKEYPYLKRTDQLDIILFNYATETFNVCDSIIDKDFNYSQNRKDLELEFVNRSLNKLVTHHKDSVFIQSIHHAAKQKIVKYFPDLMRLSSVGYLMMERYTKMMNIGFCVSLDNILSGNFKEEPTVQ